jgi:hypothetical protein
VDVECGRDQHQQWRDRGELANGKVAEALEFAAGVVPGYAGPGVEALQRQVDVFFSFQFQNRQAAIARDGEDADHGAVGGGERRHLEVAAVGIKALVQGTRCGIIVMRLRFVEPRCGIYLLTP